MIKNSQGIFGGLLAAGLTIGISGCGEPSTKPVSTVTSPPTNLAATGPTRPEDVRTAVFDVKGMTWPVICTQAVVTAYKSSAGVTDASVDFKAKMVTVTYDSVRTNSEILANVLSGTPFSASRHVSVDDKN